MKMPEGLTGVNEFLVSMKKVDTALKSGASQDIMALAKMIAERAAQICAVDLGNMRDSIEYYKVDDFTAEITAGGGVWGGVDVDYPAFVEFGTRKMDAQPFMRPAADFACKEIGGSFTLQTFVNRALK